jgi:hypothetical protein
MEANQTPKSRNLKLCNLCNVGRRRKKIPPIMSMIGKGKNKPETAIF